MKALQLIAFQQAGEYREVAQPDPGPGQVLVRIGGAGACHSDLHLMHDFPPGALPWPVPFTLGHENAGWVEALGAGVSGLEIGQPVAVYGPWGCGHCHRCRLGIENYCENQATIAAAGGGLGADGGMAPYMLVPAARHVLPLHGLDPVQAAPLTDAGLTPYHAIKRSLPLLGAGSSVVVIGAGGLGHMAVQILSALTGATIVVVDQKPDALTAAQALGAHHGVLAGENAATEVRELTGGKGADVVVDLVGADATLALGATVVRPMGHLSLVGIAGGSLAFGFFTVPYEVSLATTYWGTVPELMEVLALAEAGKITAHVERFALDDAALAYEKLARGEIAGRAVIVP